MIKQIPYLIVIALFMMLVVSCAHEYTDESSNDCRFIDHKLVDGKIYQQYHCEVEETVEIKRKETK